MEKFGAILEMAHQGLFKKCFDRFSYMHCTDDQFRTDAFCQLAFECSFPNTNVLSPCTNNVYLVCDLCRHKNIEL